MRSPRQSNRATIKEFVIPLKKDDLLASHAGRYTVEEIIPLRIVSQAIEATKAALQNHGASFILHKFDTFFAVLVHGNKVDLPIVIRAFRRITKAISQLVEEMEKFHGLDMENEERLKYCCINKMLAYLFTSFILHIDERVCVDSNNFESTGKRKRPDRSESEKEWEDDKERVLIILYRWFQLPLSSLWQPPIAEDSFISIVTQACYKLLERSKDNKQKNLRQTIFEILGTLVKRYNHGLTCVVKMIQLIQLNEALALPIAQGVIHMVNYCDCKGFIQKIIQEIGHSEPGESESRNISVFLDAIANTEPQQIVPIIRDIQDHLASEHYTMRNCVIGVLGVVVQKSLSGEELTDEQKLLRDESLDNLEEHMLDCNAYVRSKVLQVWHHLCCDGAVPLARQTNLVKAAALRLEDKSAIVRKQALQLIRSLIQGNPFAGKLDSAEISKFLERESEKLKDLQATVASASGRGDSHRAEIWNTLMPQIRIALKKVVEADGNNMNDENNDEDKNEKNKGKENEEDINIGKGEEEEINPDFAFENVRQLMLNEKVFDAVSYLWRVCTKLEQAPDMSNLKPEEKEECLFIFLLKIFMESEDISMTEKLGKNAGTETILTEEEKKQRDEIKNLKRVVGYLKNSFEFATELEKTIPVAEKLLFSTTAGDAIEACTLLGIASQFGIAGATSSIRKAMFQVFHQESSVRENLGLVYKSIYFAYTQQEKTPRQKAAACVQRLMLLVKELQPGESPALAQLMVNWYKKKELTTDILQILWEKFSMKSSETTVLESRAAVALISMIVQGQNDIITDNFEVLVKVGFGQLDSNNLLLARDTCRVLLKIKHDYHDIEKTPVKYDNGCELFEKIVMLLTKNFNNLKNDGYISFATDAINVIYHLANKPEHLSKKILTMIWNNENLVKTDDNGLPAVSMFLLAKFLYILGHIAIRQMVYMDTYVYKELKRRNFLRESKKEKKSKKNTSNISHKSATAMNHTPNSARQILRSKEASSLVEDNGEDALDGAADDADAEYINDIIEREIVTGNGMLVKFVPLVLDVCQHPEKYDTEQVQAAGVLALSKMMTVSSIFCEEYLQLLVTILERSPYPGIRANVLIGMSDLTIRFPNQVEPWSKHIYGRLRDDDTHVRATCARMLSSLIMKEMVRVKGQVSELALCIVDKDPEISQHTRQFFRVLSLKGNALYNVMPDILSRLVDPKLELEESVFQEIIKFILGLVQKERQVDTIIEKVCARFKLSTTERQWRDLSYCLSLLQFSVKSLRHLIESLPLLKEKIHHKEVLKVMKGIIDHSKKKADSKTVAIELEEKINGLLNGNESTEPSDSQIMPPPTAPAPKKLLKKVPRKKILSSSDEDSDGDVKQTSTRKTRPVKRKSMENEEKSSSNSDSDSDSDTEKIPIKTPNKQRKRMLSQMRGAKTPGTAPSPMAKRNKPAKTQRNLPRRASSRLSHNK